MRADLGSFGHERPAGQAGEQTHEQAVEARQVEMAATEATIATGEPSRSEDQRHLG
jgi:hypothetical protein